MEKKIQKLPVGDASFESIRKRNGLYVDKTRYIFKMIDKGKYYFISRPRRFGKSLTVSTLKCLFEGKKELFDDLWIAAHGQWQWKKHPVIVIDFNQISHDTPENLKHSLQRSMMKMAQAWGVTSDAPLIKDQFKELILSLYEKTKMPVVILIDEYDKPLIDYLGKGDSVMEIAKANREILRHFLGVIKGGEVTPLLEFVFVTGVSKFSQVSIFSELNNLTDLTMYRQFADMMGYTQSELEICFSDHIHRFATDVGESRGQIIEKMKNFYNGYRFSETDVRVYNPFSVLRALDECRFRKYWFETGTPTFLVNLIHEQQWNPPAIESMQATESLFSQFDIENLQLEALLFQAGYVTIKNVQGSLYQFGYPNQEVKTAFLENLFRSYTAGLRPGLGSKFVLLSGYLEHGELEAFIETVSTIYADIPYTLETKRDEAYFHTLFYLMVSASGVTARSEVLTSRGRIDLIMEFQDKIYIIEFKCNQSADTALKQIHEKEYASPHRQSGKAIHLMGINFDTDKRNISEWKHEPC